MHRAACLLLLALAFSGCDRGFPTSGPEPTISEARFIEAMVELRTAAFRQESGELPTAERDEILRRLGLDPQDLVTFAEVHGPDIPFMFGVWARVDSLAAATTRPPATAPAEGGEPGALPSGEGNGP